MLSNLPHLNKLKEEKKTEDNGVEAKKLLFATLKGSYDTARRSLSKISQLEDASRRVLREREEQDEMQASTAPSAAIVEAAKSTNSSRFGLDLTPKGEGRQLTFSPTPTKALALLGSDSPIPPALVDDDETSALERSIYEAVTVAGEAGVATVKKFERKEELFSPPGEKKGGWRVKYKGSGAGLMSTASKGGSAGFTSPLTNKGLVDPTSPRVDQGEVVKAFSPAPFKQVNAKGYAGQSMTNLYGISQEGLEEARKETVEKKKSGEVVRCQVVRAEVVRRAKDELPF